MISEALTKPSALKFLTKVRMAESHLNLVKIRLSINRLLSTEKNKPPTVYRLYPKHRILPWLPGFQWSNQMLQTLYHPHILFLLEICHNTEVRYSQNAVS